MSDDTETNVVQQRSLSCEEQELLRQAEANIERGFWQLWINLKIIHDQHLYREHYDTFEAYCLGRWERTRRWGYQQVEAGRVYQVIEAGLCTNGTQCALPTSERQIRPLVSLDDNQIVQVWNRAVSQAEGVFHRGR